MDTQLSRLKSSDFFIDDGELPVLDDYANVVDDGTFTYEQRRKLLEKYKEGVPRRKGIRALLFGKGKEKNKELEFEGVEFEDLEEGSFKTDGDLNEADLNRIESELRDEANRIEWGSDSNRIPAPSEVIQPENVIRPAQVLDGSQ